MATLIPTSAKHQFKGAAAVTTCGCCGKSELKGTFCFEIDGGQVFYGSTCAERWTGLSGRRWLSVAKAEALAAKASAARAEVEASREWARRADALARLDAARARNPMGAHRDHADAVRWASNAVATLRAAVARKHGIRVNDLVNAR